MAAPMEVAAPEIDTATNDEIEVIDDELATMCLQVSAVCCSVCASSARRTVFRLLRTLCGQCGHRSLIFQGTHLSAPAWVRST